jgi:hypothetical protein
MSLKPKQPNIEKSKKTQPKKQKTISQAKVLDRAIQSLSHVTMRKAGTKEWKIHLDIKVRVIPNAVKDVSNPSIKGFDLSVFTPHDFDFTELKREIETNFSKIEYSGEHVFLMHTQHCFWIPKDTTIK